MGDIALVIDSTSGNFACMWCESPFDSVDGATYCSDECRREMSDYRLNSLEPPAPRVPRNQGYHKLQKTGLFYRDYIDENAEIAKKRGMKLSPPKEDIDSGTRYKVPELTFRRFPEGKKPIILKRNKPEGWDNE